MSSDEDFEDDKEEQEIITGCDNKRITYLRFKLYILSKMDCKINLIFNRNIQGIIGVNNGLFAGFKDQFLHLKI